MSTSRFLMEMLCMIWLMLYTMKFISAYERIYQPYGPRMCKALEARYGSVKYHSNNFTCYVSGEKTNKSCRELIYNRKGQAVCIKDERNPKRSPSNSRESSKSPHRHTKDERTQNRPPSNSRESSKSPRRHTKATSPESRSPQLFLEVDRINLLKINILSGKQGETITHPGSQLFMSCVIDEHKIYFHTMSKRLFSVNTDKRKVGGLTKLRHRKKILGMAVDGNTHILYAFTKSNILKLRIGKDTDFDQFQTLASPRGIVTAPKRGQLFAHNYKGIYSYSTRTGKGRGTYPNSETADLVYDGFSDSLYIAIKEKYLLRLSCDLRKPSTLMTFKKKVLNICVYQGIAFIYLTSEMIHAMNMTSKNEIWSSKHRHVKDLCVL